MSLLPNFFGVPVARAHPRIMLAGKDISSNLDPHQLTFAYSDHAEGKGDSIDIELQDVDRTWIDENFPLKGAKLEAFIKVSNWPAFPGQNLEQRCGSFTIDSVTFKGPPNTLSIKANSIPTNTKIKARNTTKAWEDTTFRKAAEQVADENDMEVDWQSKEDPTYERLEQMDQSDLSFLQSRADENGLAMKVTDNKIVFFDEEDYEQKEPVDTIAYDQNVLTWSFNTKLTDIVAKSSATYQNPATGKVTQEDFEAPADDSRFLAEAGKSGGAILDHSHPGYEPRGTSGGGGRAALIRFAPFDVRAGESLMGWTPNMAQDAGKGAAGSKVAKRRAKKLARKANKNENSASFTVVGNPLFCAGKTVKVDGFGKFNGKYIIQTATHKISSGGYTTDLRLTLTLKGY